MWRLIWAQGRDGVIGVGNRLPWHITEDSQRFRRLTQGGIVLMGRRTWDSLPSRFRPLPGRDNWVLTRDPHWRDAGATVVTSLDACRGRDLWIGGGAAVYEQALPFADECWVTDIDATFPGDTHAPRLGPEWTDQSDHPESSGWHRSGSAPVDFRYRILVRSR